MPYRNAPSDWIQRWSHLVPGGAPVLDASNRVIGQLRAALGADFPIIGVGGVMSGPDAVSKIKAGADVVQIYTGLIYKGPALVTEAANSIKKCR